MSNLTVTTVSEMFYDELYEQVNIMTAVDVPVSDVNTPVQVNELTPLLADLSNVYGLLTELWGVVNADVRYYRSEKKRSLEENARNKKEYLYEKMRAVKLKYEAVSRLITVYMNEIPQHRSQNKPFRFNEDE